MRCSFKHYNFDGNKAQYGGDATGMVGDEGQHDGNDTGVEGSSDDIGRSIPCGPIDIYILKNVMIYVAAFICEKLVNYYALNIKKIN